jgi:hypothetical protein
MGGRRGASASLSPDCRFHERAWNRRGEPGVNGAMNRTAPGLFVVLIVLLAACATPDGSPEASETDGGGGSEPPPSASDGGGGTGGIEHPTGADEPILIVEETGGFAMPQMIATRVPTFALYGDGRVIMQGMQTLEFPGPALPALIERTMTEEGIQVVLEAVEETNLFTADLELRGAMNVVADATDTVFRASVNGNEVAVTVYALGMLDPTLGGNFEGIDQSEIDAHAVLNQLRDALLTIDTSVPSDAWEAEGWQPYTPTGFRLYVRDVTGEPIEGGELPGMVREWPTDDDPATFGEELPVFGDGTRCGAVEGDAAEAWFEELSASTQQTIWTSDGDNRFTVVARPLFPGEEVACPQEIVSG